MRKILCPRLEKNKVFNELLKQADSYFELHTPKIHPNGSTTYMGMAICNLALSYILTKDNKYLFDAKRFMDTVTSYNVWGANHLVNVDLSASFILFGLSLGFNWLYDFLTQEERIKYYKKIKYQAKIMYEYKIQTLGYGWSTNYWQNHNWINHTSILMASFVIQDAEAKIWQEDAIKNFDYIYNNLPNDGSNYEGVTYWRYGGIWLFISAYLIKEELGINYFDRIPYFKNTFYFRLYQTDASLVKQLNFGDCQDRYSSHPVFLYYMVAKIYKDPYARWYADFIFDNYLYEEQYRSKVKPGILPEMWLCYLFYEDGEKKAIYSLPKYRVFSDLGLVTIRSSYSNDAITFGIKCGYPGGKTQFKASYNKLNYLSLSHHHPDNLSYILTKNNDYFVIDDGYNRNIEARDHNTLLVDGKLLDVMNTNDCYKASMEFRIQEGESIADYFGTLTNFKVKNDIYVLTLDNSNMYPKNLELEEVSRTLITPNLDYLIFINNFKSKNEHIYEINLNSDYEPIRTQFGDKYEGHESEMYHYVLGNDLNRNLYSKIVKSVMTTQEPDNYCLTKLNGVSYSTNGNIKTIVEIISFKPLDIVVTDHGYQINGNKLYINSFETYKTDAKAMYVFKYRDKNYISLIKGKILYKEEKEIFNEENVSNYIIEI